MRIEKTAEERIKKLFELAERATKGDKELARRYVRLAREIAKRARVKIPRELKRKFCKKCNAYWIPGVTCRVRLHEFRRVIYTCSECGAVRRFPYARGERTFSASKNTKDRG